jgi:glycosyltransferase involved in cell wall biosynthesis
MQLHSGKSITAKTKSLSKKAIFIAPFFSDEAISNRSLIVSLVMSHVENVDIVTTNFDHQSKVFKQERQFGDNRCIYYIKTLQYKSNISISRFLSHFLFSVKAALFYLKRRNEYDLVYVTLPLNLVALLVFLLSRNKIKIADIVDIWPDVLPFPRKVKTLFLPFFLLWGKCFQLSINKCDVLMTVSDSFLEQSVKYFRKDIKFAKRFYIGHAELPSASVTREDLLTIVYVGNIGHLYDFNTLINALSQPEVRCKYQLYLIGDGDKREWLLEQLQRLSIKHTYFGIVYDEKKLAEILNRCDIGFNGYINTTASFSYKASTYFAARLPILNSMPGDMRTLVRKWGIGYNYTGGDSQSLAMRLSALDKDALRDMSEKSREFFKNEIDLKVIMSNMELFIKSIIDCDSMPGR